MQIHVVSSGETLFSIARQYDVPAGILARYNGLAEPYRLAVGQSLLILRPTSLVTVRAGDTLSSLARQNGQSVRSLLRLNPNLTQQTAIYPGQIVVTAIEDAPERTAAAFGYAYPYVSPSVLAGILPYAGGLAPFTYGFTEDGTLVPLDDSALLAQAAEKGRENVLYIHVPLVVSIPGTGELKSKPTQHSVKELLSVGIQPDILVCRTDSPLPEDLRRKIALFCNMEEDCVIQNLTASTLYEVPLLLEREGLCRVACRKLGLPQREPDLAEWTALVQRINGVHKTVQIALVGKYTGLHDAYLSVVESLFHAGTACDARVNIKWVDSEGLTAENVEQVLGDCSGILVPGGFGDRGIEGMILAAQYAREKDVPYFGICLGMQIAVIEYARHVAGWADAHSAEFSGLTAHPVIALMPDQVGITAKGGTMRLGKYPCVLAEGTQARAAYGAADISERHRHRYEFNNQFRRELQDAGLRLAGLSPDGHLVEIVEEPANTWFVGVQFHPEFKSRPNRPHPLFVGFVQASLDRQG